MANVAMDVPIRCNATSKMLVGALKCRMVFTRMREEYTPLVNYNEETVRETKKVGVLVRHWDNAIAFVHLVGFVKPL